MVRGRRRATRALLLGTCAAVAGGERGHASASEATVTAAPTATDVRLALSPDGRIGAWLVAGPLNGSIGEDETRFAPRLDAPVGDGANAPRWRLAWTGERPLDVAAALNARGGDRMAYAGGVLHVANGGRHVLLLGANDGVSVLVDGRRIFTNDGSRPLRDDDDLVAMNLAQGDHAIILALHRRGGAAWGVRARLLDGQLQPPRDAGWLLPGTGAEHARDLAAGMSSVSLDRQMDESGYRPVLTVRFPEGAPRGVRLHVRARMLRGAPTSTVGQPLFDVDAGDVAVDDRAVRDLLVTLPRIGGDEIEDEDWTLHVDVAERGFDFPWHPRRAVREAVAHAKTALEQTGAPSFAPASVESVEHLRDRLVAYVSKGDGDGEAQLDDARELDEVSSLLEQQRDPYIGSVQDRRSWRTGAMRRAYRSPADGHLSEFAVYVPPDFDPAKTYPLIVALHGMNGRPLEMIMWLFGHDDPARDGNWEDRHPRRDLPPLEAIVVAPDGHFNTMYRDVGEEDVMRVVQWAKATYPVDPARVTITGPSMGGIGTAACALHHPDHFAAAEPLCGYHSYFVRGDIGGRPMRPWERFLAEQRSNVFWAENGMYIPMYVVHGTRDLPQENSGVLIDRYEELHYTVKHEHPDLGHNVWQMTYEDLAGARWLLSHRRPIHPRAVRFKTPRSRWADDAWVHVRALSASDGWGEVIARIDADNVMWVATHGLAGLALDRDAKRIDDAAPVVVNIDGDRALFQAGEPIELHRVAGKWSAGAEPEEEAHKHGAVTGPIGDAFHEPLLFVWGASDPAQSRANEEVARAWAHRPGARVDYPIMSDLDFYSRGEPLANDRALFLVGTASSNRVVRELEPAFPIRVDGDAVMVGTKRFAPKGGDADRSELGAAFIRPNPRRPDRYVVVVEGAGPLGTWRSLSLPDLLPDYVVFDQDLAPARDQLLLGAGQVRAGGFFATDWSLP
jgi:poly(3-hydroxybutyrate) depolymerase